MSLITVEDYLNFPVVQADQRLAYGTDENQFIDLFLPEADGKKRPLIILIHGGCWRAQYDLVPMGQFAKALTADGCVVASLEYRRLGNGGGWPNTFLDVAAAADSLKEQANALQLDLSKVLTVGHSAGGHLALWLAARAKLAPDSLLYKADGLKITAVVSIAGVADLYEGEAQALCGEAIHELTGGTPDKVPNNYRDASPSSHLPLGKQHIHIVGEHDQIVPPDFVQSFVDKANAAGDEATLIVEPNAAHFEVVSTTVPAWDTVRQAIISLPM